jgi:hypothetical protein
VAPCRRASAEGFAELRRGLTHLISEEAGRSKGRDDNQDHRDKRARDDAGGEP